MLRLQGAKPCPLLIVGGEVAVGWLVLRWDCGVLSALFPAPSRMAFQRLSGVGLGPGLGGIHACTVALSSFWF